MRPFAVVLDAPSRDLPPRVEQIPEPAYVQTLVSQPAMRILVFCVGLPGWM
jgi:hypothetical protein